MKCPLIIVLFIYFSIAFCAKQGKYKSIGTDIKFVGVNDHELERFEGIFPIPKGISYNSYIIIDEKVAVIDSVDILFIEEWLANIKTALNGRTPDYFIVQSIGQDHAGGVDAFMEAYPKANIVASKNIFTVMKRFIQTDFIDRRTIIDNTQLSLGNHTLQFFKSIVLPEVYLTFDSYAKTVFSVDIFSKFGAIDIEEEWDDEARRFFFSVIAKYRDQVHLILKKLHAMEIKMICPGHGVILTDDLEHYFTLYEKWSTGVAEEEGVVVVYASVYGHTEKAVENAVEKLKEEKMKVVLYNLANGNFSYILTDVFKFNKVVFATLTINEGIYPEMRNFINYLLDRQFSKRTVGFIESGSWEPNGEKNIKMMLKDCKDITYINKTVHIFSALSKKNEDEIKELVKELSKDIEIKKIK